MRGIVIVIADCRHTHSERRFEEGNGPFRSNERRISQIQLWEKGHERTDLGRAAHARGTA
jgi:hypothetical protein